MFHRKLCFINDKALFILVLDYSFAGGETEQSGALRLPRCKKITCKIHKLESDRKF